MSPHSLPTVPLYRKKLDRKRRLAKKAGIKLVCIKPKDLKDPDKLKTKSLKAIVSIWLQVLISNKSALNQQNRITPIFLVFLNFFTILTLTF